MIFGVIAKRIGHRVFAQYYIDRSTVVTTGVDANGSRRGCGSPE